jgi:exodeoxyribonuclease X
MTSTYPFNINNLPHGRGNRRNTMVAIVLDTETHKLGGNACELAWMDVKIDGGIIERGGSLDMRFNPLEPMTYGAMAVHGITDAVVARCSQHTEIPHYMPKGLEYIIGHQVDYDCAVLERAGVDLSGVRRICTLALARRHIDCDSHTLGALFLYVAGVNNGNIHTVRQSHGAWTDVQMTVAVLDHLVGRLGVLSFDALYDLSQDARIPIVMPFGEHKDKKISDLPAKYVGWLLKQPDLDPYLRHALTPEKLTF